MISIHSQFPKENFAVSLSLTVCPRRLCHFLVGSESRVLDKDPYQRIYIRGYNSSPIAPRDSVYKLLTIYQLLYKLTN